MTEPNKLMIYTDEGVIGATVEQYPFGVRLRFRVPVLMVTLPPEFLDALVKLQNEK